MTRAAAVLAMLCVFLRAETAAAHGTGYKLSAMRALSLEFYYSTDEAMSYQEAKAFSPSDEKNAFQSGRTDEFGRYSFIPDRAGEWKVVVKDREGHMAQALVAISGDFFESPDETAAPAVQIGADQRGGLSWRAILGVSLIFNIAAFISLARAGKGRKGARA